MPTDWNEPFARFTELFELAKQAQPKDPNAATLATVDAKGLPSARVVLMKGVDARGFVVFTNYESRKGRELTGQKVAALCFYWPSLDRQVRIEGTVEKVTAAESDEYFATRARVSQLGAWASLQSQPLDDRKTLEQRVAEFDAKFAGKSVPYGDSHRSFAPWPLGVGADKPQLTRISGRHFYAQTLRARTEPSREFRRLLSRRTGHGTEVRRGNL